MSLIPLQLYVVVGASRAGIALISLFPSQQSSCKVVRLSMPLNRESHHGIHDADSTNPIDENIVSLRWTTEELARQESLSGSLVSSDVVPVREGVCADI